jgi:hypothetical protein
VSRRILGRSLAAVILLAAILLVLFVPGLRGGIVGQAEKMHGFGTNI